MRGANIVLPRTKHTSRLNLGFYDYRRRGDWINLQHLSSHVKD